MATLTVDRFEVGLDRRKGQLASDANRLWEAENVYVNTGRHIQKRPGLHNEAQFSSLLASTVGLVAADGYLNAFIRGSSAAIVSAPLRVVYCNYAAATAIGNVHFGQSYAGAIFALIETTGKDLITMFDTTVPPDAILEEVVDANCPTVGTEQTYPCAIVLGSKVWMGDDKTVDYTSTANGPSNWTTAADAGSINAAREALGSTDVKALGQYQGDLIIFFEDSAQAWSVDPDPAFISLRQSIDSVGCPYPRTVSNLASDCFFLARQGFRSISLLSLTSNLADIDLGTAIDDLVRTEIASLSITPFAEYHPNGGQYVCCLGANTYVYSFSRTAKISAWSRYTFVPGGSAITPVAFATLNGRLYLRHGANGIVYWLDPAEYNDAGTNFTASFRTTMFDMKAPGALKMVHGFDIVQVGTCDVRFHYQYIDVNGVTQTGTTDWITSLPENSRPGGMIPLGLAVTELAMEARNITNAAWEFHGVSIYYDILGSI